MSQAHPMDATQVRSPLPFDLARRARGAVTELRERAGRLGRAAAAVTSWRSRELPPAIDATVKEMRTRHGQRVSFYADKSAHGRPLLLLHSVNACASSAEMRPLFERFRGVRPVYALDLPGFGLSDRDERDYRPELYADEIADVLGRVKDKHEAPDVVALSLSCELAARAALDHGHLVHSLAFISPTGLEGSEDGHAGAPLRFARHGAAHPLWERALYAAIVTRPSIRHYLKKSFVGRVPADLERYARASSHRKGASNAPLAFLEGKLFTPRVHELYAQLRCPVLAVFDQDGYTRFDRLPDLVSQSGWTARRIVPTRGMPQFEQLDATAEALEQFWAEHAHKGHEAHHA